MSELGIAFDLCWFLLSGLKKSSDSCWLSLICQIQKQSSPTNQRSEGMPFVISEACTNRVTSKEVVVAIRVTNLRWQEVEAGQKAHWQEDQGGVEEEGSGQEGQGEGGWLWSGGSSSPPSSSNPPGWACQRLWSPTTGWNVEWIELYLDLLRSFDEAGPQQRPLQTLVTCVRNVKYA